VASSCLSGDAFGVVSSGDAVARDAVMMNMTIVSMRGVQRGMRGVASGRGDWGLRPDGHGESVGVARADFVQDSHRIEYDDASEDGGDVDEVIVDGWPEVSSEMSFVRGVPGGI